MKRKYTVIFVISVIVCLSAFVYSGILLHNKILRDAENKNAIYNEAVKVSTLEDFNSYISDYVGNMFCKVQVSSKQSVSHADIKGEYLYIETKQEVAEQEATPHYDGDGNYTHTTYERQWVTKHRTENNVNYLTINGITVPFSIVTGLPEKYVNLNLNSNISFSKITKEGKYGYQGNHIRSSYEVIPKTCTGTMYLHLDNGKISPAEGVRITFYENTSPQKLYEQLYDTGTSKLVVLWIFYSLVILIAVTLSVNFVINKI